MQVHSYISFLIVCLSFSFSFDSLENKKEREDWVAALRDVVPRAKLRKQAELIVEKQEAVLRRQDLQSISLQTIDHILKEADHVVARTGLKSNADALTFSLTHLIKVVDGITSFDEDQSKLCENSVHQLVNAANSLAATCNNSHVQQQIIQQTKSLIKQVAKLLDYSTTAESDEISQEKMYQSADLIKSSSAQMADLVMNYSEYVDDLQHLMEDVQTSTFSQRFYEAEPFEISALEFDPINKKALLEREERHLTRQNTESRLRDQQHNANVKELLENKRPLVEVVSKPATLMQELFDHISLMSCSNDEIKQFSKKSADLLANMLDATQIVAGQCGAQSGDQYTPFIIPESCAAKLGENRSQQLRLLVTAANGFAAATSNMLDILKQVPYQQNDTSVHSRVSAACSSSDTALNSFLRAVSDFDIDFDSSASSSPSSPISMAPSLPLNPVNTVNVDEDELSRKAIEDALKYLDINLSNLSQISPKLVSADSKQISTCSTLDKSTLDDSKEIVAATRALLQSAAQSGVGGEDLRSGAQGVADATGQLVDSISDPNCKPNQVIAAVRCVRAASSRLATTINSRSQLPTASAELKKGNVEAEMHNKTIGRIVNKMLDSAHKNLSLSSIDQEDQLIEKIMRSNRAMQLKHEYDALARISQFEADLDSARRFLFRLRRSVYGRGEEGV